MTESGGAGVTSQAPGDSVRRGLGPGDISILSCCALVAIIALSLASIRPDPSYLHAAFTVEHIELLGMFDSRGQQWAHRIMVALLVVGGVAIWTLRPVRFVAAPAMLTGALRKVRANAGLLVLAFVSGSFVLYLRSQPRVDYYDLQGRFYALTMLPSARTQLLLMGLSAAAVFTVVAARHVGSLGRRAREVGMLVAILLVAYVLAVYGVGLLKRPDFHGFSPEGLTAIEWHYSGSVAPADRLAAGSRLGEVPIHAGLLPSVLLAKWQQFMPLDFGGHIRFIGILQALFFLTAAGAYWIWYRRRWVPAVLAILLTIPWIHPLHAAVLYPNQSAWRFLGLAFGVFVLVILHARPVRSLAWLLGVAGGIGLLWNIESGICLCASYIVFLVVRSTSEPGGANPVRIAVSFVAGLAVSIVGFACMIRVAFGYWPDAIAVIVSFPLIGGFAQGYAGLELKRVDPLAALIFAHSLYLAMRELMRWGSGGVPTARSACQFALAGLIVLWAAYYFKGPHLWNLWSFVFLYGFLIGHLLSIPRAKRGMARLMAFLRAPGLMAVSLIVIPAIVTSNMVTLQSVLRALHVALSESGCLGGSVVSGVCLPPEMGDALREKATSLRERHGRQRVLFFSANSYLMPVIAGISPTISARDAFMNSIRRTDFDRLVWEVRGIRPTCVLLDAPESLFRGSVFHRSFYGRLRAAISPEYKREGASDGWEAWCRTVSSVG